MANTNTAAMEPMRPLEAAGLWARHLMCFVLPLTVLGFTLTAPHVWYLSWLWLLPIAASVVADFSSPAERRQPRPDLPAWPFDAILFALVALQAVNIVLAVHMVSAYGFWRFDTLTAVVLVGINSGYSAIVAAHELIHRPQKHMQNLGRFLLCTVMYEHFFTEHIRGHHSRVATHEDPATARFGETYREFWRRTLPAQFRSAWRLEAKRLGDPNMKWTDRRILKSRVLHGIVAETSLALAILAVFGPGALVAFLLQALVAVRALEAVNYFEHWGLRRPGRRRVRPTDSWDTDSRFTLYTLVGLSRHADHHAWASRPYHQLRHWEESPKLPAGYFGTVMMVWFTNRRLRDHLTAELRSRGLGPFENEQQVAA